MFKLSVAGSKGTDADVYLWGKSSTTGEYFPDTAKSQSVAKALRDPKYEKSECIPCFPPSGATLARRTVPRRGVYRRADSMGLCCHLPSSEEASEASSQAPSDNDEDSYNSDDLSEGTLFTDSKGPEGEIVLSAPELELRDPETEEGATGFLADLKSHSFGQIICKAIDEKFLADLREIFKGPKTAKAYETLDIRWESPYLWTFSEDFMKSTDESSKFVRDVVSQVSRQLEGFTQKLLPGIKLEDFDVKVVLSYYPPPSKEQVLEEFWDWSNDKTLLTFEAADRSGLKIVPHGEQDFSRWLPEGEVVHNVEPKEQTLSGWFGHAWMHEKDLLAETAAYHAAWSQAMLEEGRLSIMCGVFLKE